MDDTKGDGALPQTETAMFSTPNLVGGVPRLALTPEELAESTGVGRSTIFEAIRNEKLTARKAGTRTTLIECEEARRWLRSLPWRGRPPEATTATAAA